MATGGGRVGKEKATLFVIATSEQAGLGPGVEVGLAVEMGQGQLKLICVTA